MDDQTILSTIQNLERMFTVVLGLGLAESFKQFISDKAESPHDRVIRWDRLPALLAFLVLIIPFYHGIGRYFFIVYKTPPLPNPYAPYLITDSFVFLVQSCLFFLMSRELPLIQWRRFYQAAVSLILLNAAWALSLVLTRDSTYIGWMWINAMVGTALLIVLKFFPAHEQRTGAWICVGLLVARTTADYAFHWEFFFPS